jgi:hypothetical protein
MALQISISNAIGARAVAGGGGVDPDAQAFITAAAITDPTQQSAINTLVTDLKGYGVWTKMKALYPFVGGTAAQHKWNLKDPRDLDVAFRLVFSGGWTHSSNGALPNGTNAYADTKLTPSSVLSNANHHLSYYSRTQALTNSIEIGVGDNYGYYSAHFRIRFTGGAFVDKFTFASGNTVNDALINTTNTDSRGHFLGNILSTSNRKTFKNGIVQGTNTNTTTNTLGTGNIFLAAYNTQPNLPGIYSTKECAFASIGDGLTDTEAANFYTAVQTFQVTLGRSIGTQTVSDADAQAFVTNAGIVDQVEANAINNLVIGLKADSLWTKMKAIYPFVGGTSTTHKYNLVNPLDTDGAFRLVFSGGWTHSSTGANPNGTNAYADTKLTPSPTLSLNSTHVSLYSRTNTNTGVDMGVQRGTTYLLNVARNSNQAYTSLNSQSLELYSSTDGRGFYLGNRQAINDSDAWKNGTKQVNSTNTTNASEFAITPIFIGAFNQLGSASGYSNKELAFASIGDGLTDTEAANFYTAVQAFQTALNRNI